MDDAQKAALALGREQSHAVRRYLEAISRERRHRRARPVETIERALDDVEQRWATADPVARLHLAQRRIELRAELATHTAPDTALEELEAAFIKAAADYAKRKRLSYAAFRELGVDAEVLRRAGIRRRRG